MTQVAKAGTGLQHEIEERLSAQMPEVEVVLAEAPSPGLLRVYIDRHPDGVDLELCQRVSRELSELRERYALEVTSPGLDRPLVKPAHYQRVVGQTVAVSTDAPIEGRRKFRGRLVAADDAGIELEQDGSAVELDYAQIHRSHLVFDAVGGAR